MIFISNKILGGYMMNKRMKLIPYEINENLRGAKINSHME